MYGRIAAGVSATALVGFVAGAASMGSYVADHARTPEQGGASSTVAGQVPVAGQALNEIADPLRRQACRVGDIAEWGNSVPVLSQVAGAASAAVDAIGGIAGSGQCVPNSSQRA